MRIVSLICATAVVMVLHTGAVAWGSAPPVGKLPPAKVVQQTVRRGSLIAVALPAPTGGNVWRVARAFNARVASEVEERTLRSSIVIVFRAKSPGRTAIVYALTAGETSPRALKAITLDLRVT